MKNDSKKKTSKIKTILTVFFAYITLCGLVMFPCFILEEAFQTTMFGTWPAQDSKNWNLVLAGCDLMRGTNRTLKVVNYGFGWIQPLAFLSYRAYSHSADYYITALEHKTLAHAPEEFVGREIEFVFVPSKIIHDSQGIKLIHNRIQIIVDKMPTEKKAVVRGKVELIDGRIVINTKLKKE